MEIAPSEPLFGEEVESTTVNRLRSKRMAITYLFVHVYHAPPRDFWSSRGGVTYKIKTAPDLAPGTGIKQDPEGIMRCLEQGIEYDTSIRAGPGRKALIQSGSYEETMKTGCSIELLNEDLQKKHDNDKVPLVISAVYRCIRSLAQYPRQSTSSASEEA